MTDWFDVFIGVIFTLITGCILALVFSAGIDRVYQACLDHGAYYKDSKLIMKCEVAK